MGIFLKTDFALRFFSALGLVCGASHMVMFHAALAEEVGLDLGQIPYYDRTNDRSKADLKGYFQAKGPKALAMNANGQSYWWGPIDSQSEAARRALENCEFSNKSPCVLAAVDDAIQKPDAAAKPVSAFATLGNELDPGKVPFLSGAARKRLAGSLVQARKNSLQHMALALHPRNGWFLKVDPAYTSQADADTAALAACVNFSPPNKFWNRGSCFLFAEGMQIVGNLPSNVTYASAALVQAAGDNAAVVQKTGGSDMAANKSLVADAETRAAVQVVSADRIRFVHMGGDDCPPCRVWRTMEYPKLQKSASFQAVKYSYVIKTIRSPVPSEFFLPPELKPLKAKLDTAGGGNGGSPQEMLLVDDVVYDYWLGARNAEEIEAKIAAIVAGGTAYPGKRCTVRMKGWNCASKN